MRIPVKRDNVQLQGLNFSPTRGMPADAFGSSSSSGNLQGLGRGLTALGGAIVGKEEERDNTNLLAAKNMYLEAMGPIISDIEKNNQMGKAVQAGDIFSQKEQQIRADVMKNAGIKSGRIQQNLLFELDRMRIANEKGIRTFQDAEEEKYIRFNFSNQANILTNGAITVGTADAFNKVREQLIIDAEPFRQTRGDEYADALIRDEMTKSLATFMQSRFAVNDIAGAEKAMQLAAPFVDRGTLAEYEKLVYQYNMANLKQEKFNEAYKLYPNDPAKGQAYFVRALSSGDDSLGRLSSSYEGEIDSVSSGAGDSGGVSYGKYQFNSKDKIVNKFVAWMEKDPKGKKYADYLGSDVGSTEFIDRWKRLAAEDPEGFERMQDAYAKPMYYDTAAANLINNYGFDISGRSHALKEVLFSNSIQHGDYYGAQIFEEAAKLAGKPLGEMTDEELIYNIYEVKLLDDSWSAGAPDQRESLKDRWRRERQDALTLLKQASLGGNTTNSLDMKQLQDDFSAQFGKSQQWQSTINSQAQQNLIYELFTYKRNGNWTEQDLVSLEQKYAANPDMQIYVAQQISNFLKKPVKENSDTLTYIELNKMRVDKTLTQKVVDEAYHDGLLSDKHYIALSEDSYKILVKQDDDASNTSDKMWQEDIAKRFNKPWQKNTREQFEAMAFQRLADEKITGYQRSDKVNEWLKVYGDEPEEFINYYWRGQEMKNEAEKLFDGDGSKTISLLEQGISNSTGRYNIYGQEISINANLVNQMLRQADAAGDPIYREIYEGYLRNNIAFTPQMLRQDRDLISSQREGNIVSAVNYTRVKTNSRKTISAIDNDETDEDLFIYGGD